MIFKELQNEGKNIQVIETAKISPNQYAQILKIGDRYVAVAVSKENVTVLTTLEESQLNLETSKQPYKNDFASVFKKIVKDKSDDVKEVMNKVDFSIPVGISYEYKNFILEARYSIGLTDIYKEPVFKSHVEPGETLPRGLVDAS